jgi:hypothetical protein
MAPPAMGARVTIMNLCRAPFIGATLAATKPCLMAQKCEVSHPWCSGWASKTRALCIVFLVSTLCARPSASELEEVVILGARNELSQALGPAPYSLSCICIFLLFLPRRSCWWHRLAGCISSVSRAP